MKLEHEEITKRTRETITYLHHNSLCRKPPTAAGERKRDGHTHTHTDRTPTSRLYVEKEEVNRNEEAFWWKNGRMVRCEEEENGEGGCVARCFQMEGVRNVLIRKGGRVCLVEGK